MFVRQLLLNLVIQEVVKTIVLCKDVHTFGSVTMVANTLLLFNILRKILPQLLIHSSGLYKKNPPKQTKREACVHRSTSCDQSKVITGVTQPLDLKEAVDKLTKIRSMHLTRLCLFLKQYSNLIKTSRKLKSVHLHMYISSQLLLYLAQGNTYIFFTINISYR